MKRLLLLPVLFLFIFHLNAQEGGEFLETFDKELPQKANKEFQFLAFFFTKGVANNIYPKNDLLKGQIVGRLFGSNTTTTSDSLHPRYAEQRILPFFIYQPKLFNGKAIFRASLEIDWTWGDVSYGTGGNGGSAFSADQVNIQTQNIELELIPKSGWAVNLGLMRLFDSPHNPYRTYFDKMLVTGYRLSYWGSDAVGVNVRRDADFYKWKAGFYQLYENNTNENDDVILGEFSYQHQLGLRWNLGGSLYYVRDRANGEGGPSILGQGLNATLNAYNGTYRFPFAGSAYKADVLWLGTYFSFNEDYMMHRFFANGFANANFGAIQLDKGSGFNKGPSIAGLATNFRFGYRHGQTIDDIAWIDAIYTTGDKNGITDDKYSGVITGNTWGTPGAIFIGHGAYLIFPHGNVINRYWALVPDLSNMGYGVLGGTANYSKAIIPHKFSFKVGGAWAMSVANPIGGGKSIGLEANARLSYQLGPFMTLEWHSAYAWLGDFYDSSLVNGGNSERPINPWTSFIGFKWLMF
ncbi:MAG: hypothetical protein KDC85_23630 [Saprospiraceae bacterium]|nr:hypothetical protein [Saprospiraceae bacterium]MCB9326009.1 hypothetical protein [Lewinellaceae bacterium]